MKKIVKWREHLGRLLKGANEDEGKLEELKDDFRYNLEKAIKEEESRHNHMGA